MMAVHRPGVCKPNPKGRKWGKGAAKHSLSPGGGVLGRPGRPRLRAAVGGAGSGSKGWQCQQGRILCPVDPEAIWTLFQGALRGSWS